MVFQLYPLAEQLEELIERGRGMLVGEQFFLAGLTVLLVQHAELEVRHQHVFVVRGYKLRRFAAQHRRQTGQCQLIVQQLENKNETDVQKTVSI